METLYDAQYLGPRWTYGLRAMFDAGLWEAARAEHLRLQARAQDSLDTIRAGEGYCFL